MNWHRKILEGNLNTIIFSCSNKEKEKKPTTHFFSKQTNLFSFSNFFFILGLCLSWWKLTKKELKGKRPHFFFFQQLFVFFLQNFVFCKDKGKRKKRLPVSKAKNKASKVWNKGLNLLQLELVLMMMELLKFIAVCFHETVAWTWVFPACFTLAVTRIFASLQEGTLGYALTPNISDSCWL